MQNYFNYFTEIEERFQQRRGSILMLSALDRGLAPHRFEAMLAEATTNGRRSAPSA